MSKSRPSLLMKCLPRLLRGPAITMAMVLLVWLGGCRSRFVEATVENQGSTALRLIEIDYPSASFGMQSLDAGARYHYRFKIQGSGSLTVTFTDAQGKAHSITGPPLEEGQAGTLRVTIGPDGSVRFEPKLSSPR